MDVMRVSSVFLPKNKQRVYKRIHAFSNNRRRGGIKYQSVKPSVR